VKQMIESHLVMDRLNTLDNGLFNAALRTWKECEPLLRHIPATHPFHTSHGPDHASALLGIISQAIEPLQDFHLSAPELYIIASATMLHVIGMVGEAPTTKEVRDQIRRSHHVLSAQYIREKWQELCLEYEYVETIADVASAHRKIDIERDIRQFPIGTSGNMIPRTKLCASLLRLADELHVTFDRVPHDYPKLSLPSDSVEHFIMHEMTKGRAFDKQSGRIVFSVCVNDSAIAEFVEQLELKIQKEIDSISRILKENGIPYSQVEFMQNRDVLVRTKVLRYLLIHSTGTIEEISAAAKEKFEDVRRFLRNEGGLCISEAIGKEGIASYSLVIDKSPFESLAEQFVVNTNERNDCLYFIQSALCDKILSTDYIDRILCNSITAPDIRSLFVKVIRKSPSALRYILLNKSKLPKSRLDGSSGLTQSLIGEFVNDYFSYPQLILDLDLPDLLYEKANINKQTYERLKIRQVAEYHKAFPNDQVIEQWAVPNKWEIAAAKLDLKATKKFNLQMQVPGDEPTNPFMLFAAASRLGYELIFEGGSSSPLRFTIDDPDIKTDFASSTYQRLIISRTQAENIVQGTMQCSFLSLGQQEYLIAVEVPANAPFDSWKYPISAKVNATMAQSAIPRKVEIDFSISIMQDLLDCKTAATMIRAASSKNSKIFIGSKNDKQARIGPFSKEAANQLGMGLSDDMKAIVLKLAKLQTKLAIPLDFPYVGLSNGISEILQGSEIKSKKDAMAFWGQIQAVQAKETKPSISPIGLEIFSEGHVVERHYVDFYYGAHQPRATVSGPDQENIQAKLDAALEVESSLCSFSVPLRLSPLASLRYIQENPINFDGTMKKTPFVLSQMKSRTVAENRSVVTFEWQAIQDRTWYRITPFVCKCESLSPSRRFQEEAIHFSDNCKDYVRAYIAAKEAYRLANRSHETAISLGWQAFLLKRINECIAITKPALEANEPFTKYTAYINLGLAYLTAALNEPRLAPDHLAKAEQYYSAALKMLERFSPKDRAICIENAINDIDIYHDILHGNANTIKILFVNKIPKVSNANADSNKEKTGKFS
jgi:hypothetical protein